MWELTSPNCFSSSISRPFFHSNRFPSQLDRMKVDSRRFSDCPFRFPHVRNGNPSRQRGEANQLFQSPFLRVPSPGEEEDQPGSGQVRSDQPGGLILPIGPYFIPIS